MAKVKLTKNELKRQKEALKRFERYLPTLQLKKQQLQLEISKLNAAIARWEEQLEQLKEKISSWVDVFAEKIDWDTVLRIEGVEKETGNIAGIDIPVFKRVIFEEEEYDLFFMPLWVDAAIEVVKQAAELKSRLAVAYQQKEILGEELRITTQRVNLFEKVKIPQTKENIRVIRIYLGDLQTAEVVRGKIAKAKIEKRRVEKSV